MTAVWVIIFGVISTGFATKPFNFTDCNTSANKLIHFDNLHLDGHPFHINGSFAFDVDLQVLHPIYDNHFFINVTVSKYLTFGYVDMTGVPNKVVHFDHASLSSDPVHIPGPETGSIDVHVLKPISGLHYRMDVKISKKLGILGYTAIPCVNNLGTCTYELCDLLSGQNFDGVHHCPLEIKQSSPEFNCACPFAPGDYHLNATTFQIPELSGLYSWLAGGDYKVHATITDTNTQEMVGCYDISLSTETDCSGLSCLFG